MGVGDVEDLEDALDAAVLAEGTVQGVEGDVGLQPRQHVGDVAADVDAGDAVALAFQRIGAGRCRTTSDTGRSLDQPPIRTATCVTTDP